MSDGNLNDFERALRSRQAGMVPYLVDAADVCRCHQKRLCWVSWELQAHPPQVQLWLPEVLGPSSLVHITFQVDNPWEDVVTRGWRPTSPDLCFPAFVPSQPSTNPSAATKRFSANAQTLSRWSSDSHAFPPYHYLPENCLMD